MNVQLLYHEISARKLDNATRRRRSGGRQAAADKRGRKSRRAHDEAAGDEEIGTRRAYEGAAAVSQSREMQPPHHARRITVYVEETKSPAENASQRQPVCGNRDEMTLVLALIGPSR